MVREIGTKQDVELLTARREEALAMEMWQASLARLESARNEADRYRRIWADKQERVGFLLEQAVKQTRGEEN